MDAKRVSPVDRRGMKCPGYKAAPVETGWRVCAATSPVHGALPCSRAIDTCTCAGAQRRCMCRPAGWHEHALVMDAKRVSPVDRRGMKCPGYKAAPVETGWRVGAATSPVHGALPCSRAIDTCTCAGAQRRCMCRPAGWHEHALVMDAKRVSPVDRRGMKCPGYKAAPVETGWRARLPSPVHGALPCSRAIDTCTCAGAQRRCMCRPAGRHGHAPIMVAQRVSPVDRRGMKCPGYKAAPVETGWRVGATASPVHGALRCSRATHAPARAPERSAGACVARRAGMNTRRSWLRSACRRWIAGA
jgi:hypothetical protein